MWTIAMRVAPARGAGQDRVGVIERGDAAVVVVADDAAVVVVWVDAAPFT